MITIQFETTGRSVSLTAEEFNELKQYVSSMTMNQYFYNEPGPEEDPEFNLGN
jgi:hypothetical protein